MSRRALAAALFALAACTSTTATTTPTSDGVPTTTIPREPTTDAEPPSTATTPTTVSALPTTTSAGPDPIAVEELMIEAFPVPAGSRPHDVAPAVDGGVWYTGQGSGELGWLDPNTGAVELVDLGDGSRPHGVITGSDGTAWVTDGGRNSIIAVDPETGEVIEYPLPDDRADANLNTATFDGEEILWFTGQNGIYGSLDPVSGDMTVYDTPRGRGPYGIATTPEGSVYLASLAASYVGAIQADGSLEVLEPPTRDQGARRVWSDSAGSIWVSEWNSGNLSRYAPSTGEWTTWPLPGPEPAAYAVYVDELDMVWVSDFESNALVRFDPATEIFTTLPLPHQPGDVRQILGRPGEVWGAESAADHLVLIRTRLDSQ